ncbi:MAG: hypothetical protein WCN88_00890 [Candidatus Falkowbacteria bacterium]
MNKYKKVAINLAFLTMIFSAGITSKYVIDVNSDIIDSHINLSSKDSSKYPPEWQEKVLNTFENSDYTTWRKIIGENNKINNIVDETAFNNFVLARDAARNGQYNKAIKITEKLKKNVENKLA